MADQQQWQECEQAILDALDIKAEYQTLGVQAATDRPSAKGWLACHAAGRDDRNASAAIYVGTGKARGRYRDLGADGYSANLWSFAARFGSFGDWREARRHYAGKVNIRLPAGGEPRRPEDALEFVPTNDAVMAVWADLKGGFGLDEVLANGGRNARYPAKARPEQSQFVIAFPGFAGPDLADGEPTAWVIANQTGGPVRLYKGKGKPPVDAKTLSVGGSVGGLLGLDALRNLAEAEVVWKAEGLSDLLAIHAAIRAAGLQHRHVVLSNSQGALETVKPEWVDALRGKTVYVLHDCDRPGRIGASRWTEALAGAAKEVRDVALPYEVRDHHGEDARDFLFRDGHPYADLLVLADQAPPVQAAPAAPSLLSGLAPPASAPVPPAGGGVPTAATNEVARKYQDVLNMLQMEVLGEYPDRNGEIEVYCRTEPKSVRHIADTDRFSYRKLIQFCGDPACLFVHDGKDGVQGKIAMEDVRQAIGYKARQTDLTRVGTLGQGIWSADGHVVVVNGGCAAVYGAGGVLGLLDTPRVGKAILDFSAADPWVDVASLNRHLAAAADPAWCVGALGRLADVFANWNWRHPQDAWTCALLVACSFVQTLWPWRPEVAIAGPSDCGKALALDTPLPTPTGWTTMGDVRVGDQVCDERLQPCRVSAVTEVQHDRVCYRVCFDDGFSVVCSAEHLWAVDDRAGGRREVHTTKVLADVMLLALRAHDCLGVQYAIGAHRIVTIDRAPTVPVKCIQVDAPSHLYLCGRGMVPTHNSTIMRTLKTVFGGLEFYTHKPSEAGIRQHIRNTARVIMVDEFENDHHRQRILELFRTTSQGGALHRGSSDQKGRAFGLKHIPWMASIETGLTKAADRNRFIILDLQPLARGTRGRENLPLDGALLEMGFQVLAVALRHHQRAVELFYRLKGEAIEGVPGRVVESFAVPAALRAAAEGLDEAGAIGVLNDLLAQRSATVTRQGGGDESDLMHAILDSQFAVGGGQPSATVAGVITDADAYLLYHRALETNGVAMTDGRTGPRSPHLQGKRFVFLHLEAVKRYLLRNTSWAQLDCAQLLERLPGARHVQRMVGSKRIWGIEVPVADWVEPRRPEERIENYLPLLPDAGVGCGAGGDAGVGTAAGGVGMDAGTPPLATDQPSTGRPVTPAGGAPWPTAAQEGPVPGSGGSEAAGGPSWLAAAASRPTSALGDRPDAAPAICTSANSSVAQIISGLDLT